MEVKTMTSEKRRERRYQRRKARRDQKRKEVAEQYTNPEDSFGMFPIAHAYKRVRKGSPWKTSTQMYGGDIFLNAGNEAERLENRTWKPGKTNRFKVKERGKERDIQSVHIREKCVQNSVTSNCLIPILGRSLIDNNAASLPGKGTDYCLKRLTDDLRRHYRIYGLHGRMMLYDFSGYFSHIRHDTLMTDVERYVISDDILWMIRRQVESFDGEEGLGLGSPISQIFAVFYPNRLDHRFTDTCGLEGYGRYMDDGYADIPPDVDEQEILRMFYEECKALSIIPNPKKCHVIDFGKPFTFLKVRYQVSETGKIVRRMSREGIRKERDRIRAHRRLVDSGRMTYEEARLNLYSWLCSRKRASTYHVCLDAIVYFNRIFSDHPPFYPPGKKPRKGRRQQWHKVKYAAKVARFMEGSGKNG